MYAAAFGSVEAISLLLEQGADVNVNRAAGFGFSGDDREEAAKVSKPSGPSASIARRSARKRGASNLAAVEHHPERRES